MGNYSPVNGSLPASIVETVEHVQEHGANEAAAGPVNGWGWGITGILFLVCITTTPDDHGNSEESNQASLSFGGTSEHLEIKKETNDGRTPDLRPSRDSH